MTTGMVKQQEGAISEAQIATHALGRAIGVAVVVLLLGTVIYLIERPAGSVPFFAEFSFADRFSMSLGFVGASFPSFAHTFAFATFTAMLMSRRRDLKSACLSWLGIECAFEIGQSPIVAAKLAAQIPPGYESVPFLSHTIRYFVNGTFDALDLLAVGIGALVAYVFVMWATRQSAMPADQAREEH